MCFILSWWWVLRRDTWGSGRSKRVTLRDWVNAGAVVAKKVSSCRHGQGIAPVDFDGDNRGNVICREIQV